jgi:glycosyltransferase involved in cell wall biosynthesis
MQNNPIVTIVCTCFNHEKYVVESLQSVLDQSYKYIQLIVVDDCSSDNSVIVIEDYLRNFPEIIFIRNNSNLGLTKSVNNAMLQAKGAYFVDLAADDVLMPNCVAVQVATFQNTKYKNLAFVYGNAEFISEAGNHLSYFFDTDKNLKTNPTRPSGDIYLKTISIETTICSVATLYKKSIFDSSNKYDETLCYEDFDYWIRISRNYDIEFIDEILIKKRFLLNSLHQSFHKKHAIIGKSVYKILVMASKLNRSKIENSVLATRVMLEIKRSIKRFAPILLAKNSWLWLQLKLRTI